MKKEIHYNTESKIKEIYDLVINSNPIGPFKEGLGTHATSCRYQIGNRVFEFIWVLSNKSDYPDYIVENPDTNKILMDKWIKNKHRKICKKWLKKYKS